MLVLCLFLEFCYFAGYVHLDLSRVEDINYAVVVYVSKILLTVAEINLFGCELLDFGSVEGVNTAIEVSVAYKFCPDGYRLGSYSDIFALAYQDDLVFSGHGEVVNKGASDRAVIVHEKNDYQLSELILGVLPFKL